MHLVLKQAGAVTAAFTLIGLGATAQAGTTAHSGHIQRIAGVIKPLPGCAETFAPRVASTEGRVCLKKLPATVAMAPASAPFGCVADYYQNGPYGSTAWENGWGVCDQNTGNYRVPLQFNDQASAWDSSCPGNFSVNAPGTFPGAGFPADSAGNFPWGAVPNDSLSGIQGAADCRIA
ncbi:MAG TPA: hypothetical protein VFB06_26320 [Streptosporangiaceae bacterium]|nr:hypothetical protein [Streptosporangiaceae bacterium]